MLRKNELENAVAQILMRTSAEMHETIARRGTAYVYDCSKAAIEIVATVLKLQGRGNGGSVN